MAERPIRNSGCEACSSPVPTYECVCLMLSCSCTILCVCEYPVSSGRTDGGTVVTVLYERCYEIVC